LAEPALCRSILPGLCSLRGWGVFVESVGEPGFSGRSFGVELHPPPLPLFRRLGEDLWVDHTSVNSLLEPLELKVPVLEIGLRIP
jgi:hypothetical protein